MARTIPPNNRPTRAAGLKNLIVKVIVADMKDQVAHTVSPNLKKLTIGCLKSVVNQFSAKLHFTVCYAHEK